MSARPVVIWRGHGTDEGIYKTEVQEAGPGPSQQASDSASRFGVGAARLPRAGGDGFLTAWRGADGDNTIWMRTGNWGWDSPQWRPPGNPRTEDRPAIAVFGDANAAAWRGADQDEHIWFATSDGWAQQLTCDGNASSTHGPALTTLGDGRLLMAWREAGPNQGLFWSIFDGGSWTSPAPFAGGSTHGPALTTMSNGDALMVWKGSGSDDHIWLSRFHNGRWSPQQLAVGRTSHGPAISSVEFGVVMVWKGVAGDERLWWSRDLKFQHELATGFTTADTPALSYVTYTNL